MPRRYASVLSPDLSPSLTPALPLPLPHLQPHPHQVRLVLEWLYTGQCVVEHTALLDLLAAAGRLRVETLQEAATWSIIGNVLTDATCLDLWDAARRLAVPELEYAARRFALEHFEAVTASVGSLPSDVLAEMLVSDDLACSREEQVLDALMRWARTHKPSPASLAELLRHVRFDRFADASSATKTATEPLFASAPCLSVIAVKLAAQLDPAGERSSSRKAPSEPDGLVPRSLSERSDDKLSLMRKVASINREAAQFALEVEQRDLTGKVVGPLLMYLQAREGFLSRRLLANLENTLASGFLKVAAGTLPNCRPSVTIYDGCDAAAYDAEEVAKHRPPARELERYLRRQILLPDVDKDARLAWLDEVLDFHDFELSAASTAAGLTVERLRVQIEGMLRDKFHSVGTLVCTHDLPSAIIAQLLQHVQQHEAATHAQKGLSGFAAAAAPVPRLAAIVMPCQVIRLNVTPSNAALIGGTGTPFQGRGH